MIPIDRIRSLRRFCVRLGSFGVWLCFIFHGVENAGAFPNVDLERLPEGAMQPQVVRSSGGTLHSVYLRGPAARADVWYRSKTLGNEWSESVRVNTTEGSAIAVGTIRGAQLGVAPDGRVHVVWNGSVPAGGGASGAGMALWYTHSEGEKGAVRFAAQRDLLSGSHQLDGGGGVAVDGSGRVLVGWHATRLGFQGETNRAVFGVISGDRGETFGAVSEISPVGTGACGCCGLVLTSDSEGKWGVLFRGASSGVERGMIWMRGGDANGRWESRMDVVLKQEWKGMMCPMSSAGMAVGWKPGAGNGAVWERGGQIQVGLDGGRKVLAIGPVRGAKHPRLVFNGRGEGLVVWVEGTGWQRGGSVAWQRMTDRGEWVGEPERREGVAVWSFAAPYVKSDGSFVVLY